MWLFTRHGSLLNRKKVLCVGDRSRSVCFILFIISVLRARTANLCRVRIVPCCLPRVRLGGESLSRVGSMICFERFCSILQGRQRNGTVLFRLMSVLGLGSDWIWEIIDAGVWWFGHLKCLTRSLIVSALIGHVYWTELLNGVRIQRQQSVVEMTFWVREFQVVPIANFVWRWLHYCLPLSSIDFWLGLLWIFAC